MTIPQRLRHNLGLKLLSLAVALLIWGSVRNEANPIVSRHRVVKVEAVDVPPQLAVSKIDPPEVTVTLTGRVSEFDQLEYSNLRLVASVPQAQPGVQTAMLQPEGLPFGLEIRQMSRNMARVELDTVVAVREPVLIETRGQPARNFAVSGSSASPSEVVVRGPSSVMEKLARVVAPVDITGRNSNIPTVITLVARDANSVALADVDIQPAEVTVTVSVRQIKTTSVPVVPVITNIPDGYEIASVTVKPMSVTLTGEGSLLTSIESVPTSSINASNARGKITYNVTLRPPAGLSTVGSASAVVTLEVRPERPTPPAPAAAGGETTPPPATAPRPQPDTERPPREEPAAEPSPEPVEKSAPAPSTSTTRPHSRPGGASSTTVDDNRVPHRPATKTP
ncbi:MAG: YbbR-like domain-containing protein [Bacteroidota bacterium]